MVRLKVTIEEPDSDFPEFQFQYGAIKSHTLKGCGRKLKNFNSSMVRLKATKTEQTTFAHLYFNSSMVRLKANIAVCGMEDLYQFQFQYGAIKSILL